MVFQMFILYMCWLTRVLVLVLLLPLPQALKEGLLHDCTMSSGVECLLFIMHTIEAVCHLVVTVILKLTTA